IENGSARADTPGLCTRQRAARYTRRRVACKRAQVQNHSVTVVNGASAGALSSSHALEFTTRLIPGKLTRQELYQPDLIADGAADYQSRVGRESAVDGIDSAPGIENGAAESPRVGRECAVGGIDSAPRIDIDSAPEIEIAGPVQSIAVGDGQVDHRKVDVGVHTKHTYGVAAADRYLVTTAIEHSVQGIRDRTG